MAVSGMKLSVLHRTTFHYEGLVTNSTNTLRLEPADFPCQQRLSSFIRVIPATRLKRFTDLFQNITHQFELPNPHSKLEIESRLRVLNQPLVLTEKDRFATLEAYGDRSISEWIWTYLQESRWVSINPEIWRAAIDVTRGTFPVFGQACALMEWIHREFRYESGVTSANTHLDEVFEMKCGVCQDFTHVMIGMCRSVGIAARYASGYLYNGPADSLVGAQASHAWCEVYLPESGWTGFDPTNNTVVDERYVKVAAGRDYEDVAPVVGGYQGSGHCRMKVLVEVEKI